MGLYNTAWLIVEEDPRIESNRTAAFELRNVDESQSSQEPDYIMGGRGNFINSFRTFLSDTEEFGVDAVSYGPRRSGYWLDGGSGLWSETITFKVSDSSVATVWGDEQSAQGQENVTTTDASGTEINAITRRQVLDYWLAQTRSDSFGNTRIHIGEYTDGTYDDYEESQKVSATAGAFGHPIPVAVESVQLTTPEDQPGTLEGTITLQRVKTFDFDEEELSDYVAQTPELQTPVLPMPDA